MIGADVLGRLEPVASCLRENLSLVRDAGEDAVEGTQSVRADDDTATVRQVIVLANLAAVVVGELWKMGFGEDSHGLDHPSAVIVKFPLL